MKYLKIFLSFLSLLLIPVSIAMATFPNPLRADSFPELIRLIIGFLISLAVPLAVFIVLIGAFYILTSAGDPKKFETGKKVIIYAFLGLLIIILAEGLATYIIDAIF